MNYFNPNWKAINKAIAENDLTELRKQQKHLERTIQSKIDAKIKERSDAIESKRIDELKLLPIGAIVYNILRCKEIVFGAEMEKIKDGRTCMICRVAGKQWRLQYKYIQATPIDRGQSITNGALNRLEGFYSATG